MAENSRGTATGKTSKTTSTPKHSHHGGSATNTTISTINTDYNPNATIQSNARIDTSRNYRNYQTQQKISSMYFGEGKLPFKIAIGCFIAAFVVIFAGATVTGLYHTRMMPIGYNGEFVGPLIIIVGVLLIALGAYFMWQAQKRSQSSRRHVAFRPQGFSGVAAVNKGYVKENSDYHTKSGTYSEKAISSLDATTISAKDMTFASLDSIRVSDSSLDRTPGMGISYDLEPGKPSSAKKRLDMEPGTSSTLKSESSDKSGGSKARGKPLKSLDDSYGNINPQFSDVSLEERY